MVEQLKPRMTSREFLLWLCKKHKLQVNGEEKICSFRFGSSVWIRGSQERIAKFAMTSKKTVNSLMKQLVEEGYIDYVGLKTWQMSDKALKVLDQWKERPLPPSDYQDYIG